MFALVAFLLAFPDPGTPTGTPYPYIQAQDDFNDSHPRVHGYLIADVSEVTPGDTFRAGVLFRMEPGWHIYWRNPGDAAIATQLTIESLQGEVGDLQWPSPRVFRESEGLITTYGYTDEVLLFAPLQVTATEGLVEIAAHADFLACHVECVPGQFALTRTIPLGSATTPSEASGLFDASQTSLPQSPRSQGLDVRQARSLEHLGPAQSVNVWFELRCPECRQLEFVEPLDQTFIPQRAEGIRSVRAQAAVEVAGPGVLIEIAAESSGEILSEPAKIAGVLRLKRDGEEIALHLEHEIPRRATPGAALPSPFGDGPVHTIAGVDSLAPQSASAKPGWKKLLQIALLAFFGGMLLNLMPCVLPVLAIKLVGLAALGGQSRSERTAHGLVYAFGILLSMMALASFVVVLRSIGASIGWGTQFQSRYFLAVIGGVLVVFALNLFGVFEIPGSANALGALADRTRGYLRSALEGVLAVLLATPCTAPLLGTAVGFAFTQSSGVIFLVFACIGAGLAMPFVAICVLPGLASVLPKPGTWMITLKHALGFALLGSAAWLLWVLGRGHGVDTLGQTLAAWLIGAGGVWVLGLGQRAATWRRHVSGVVAFSLAVIAIVWVAYPSETNHDVEEAGFAIGWNAYDPQAIERELKDGRAVFINFTADWCITCKVNERTVFSRPSVAKAAEANNVALYKADWTRPNPQIAQTLRRFGRAGIPAYMLYSADNPESPQFLPELLTVDTIHEAFGRVRSTHRSH